MSIEHFVNLTSLNAARILNLPQQHGLSVGAPADIAIVNDTEIRSLRDEDMATLWRWTPFNGMVACGFPSHVVSRGELIYPSKLLG
jgi:dihydropyrimidinase